VKQDFLSIVPVLTWKKVWRVFWLADEKKQYFFGFNVSRARFRFSGRLYWLMQNYAVTNTSPGSRRITTNHFRQSTSQHVGGTCVRISLASLHVTPRKTTLAVGGFRGCAPRRRFTWRVDYSIELFEHSQRNKKNWNFPLRLLIEMKYFVQRRSAYQRADARVQWR